MNPTCLIASQSNPENVAGIPAFAECVSASTTFLSACNLRRADRISSGLPHEILG